MGDQAYCCGGDGGSALNVNRMYDLSGNTWTIKTVMGDSRQSVWTHRGFGAGGYQNGFAFGGKTGGFGDKTCEKYDIVGNSWSYKTAQPINRGGGNCPYLVGYIWAFGLRYDISGNSWHAGGGVGTDDYPGGIFAVGGNVYSLAASGNERARISSSDLSATAISAMPANRHNGGAFADGTYGYIIAGYLSGAIYNSNYRYDPTTNSWATRAVVGASIADQGTFVITGKGHSVGGVTLWGGGGGTTYHGRYDNTGNSWTSKTAYLSADGSSGFYVPSNLPPNAPSSLSVSST